MEHLSPIEAMPDYRLVLEGQVRECFARVVYSHKTHEKCVDILLTRLNRVQWGQIILSAITTGGLVTTLFGGSQCGVIIGAFTSTALLILNAIVKNFDLGEVAQKHKQAANELWIIREKYLSLLVDLRKLDNPIESIQKRRDDLLEQLHSVYVGAPSTTSDAYHDAQKALKILEEMTFSKDEIESLLPVELRRG